MRSTTFVAIERVARGPGGLATAFVWAMAEAIFWPILPDFFLFAVVPAAPGSWWRLGLAASAGSVAGGFGAFLIAYARSSSFPLEIAPLITGGMIEVASGWISTEGALAVLRQPLSGIPYKVFVYLSGASQQNPLVFLWGSAVARSLRIFLVAGAGAALGRIGGRERSARFYDLFLFAFTLVFAYGLWNVVRSFS